MAELHTKEILLSFKVQFLLWWSNHALNAFVFVLLWLYSLWLSVCLSSFNHLVLHSPRNTLWNYFDQYLFPPEDNWSVPPDLDKISQNLDIFAFINTCRSDHLKTMRYYVMFNIKYWSFEDDMSPTLKLFTILLKSCTYSENTGQEMSVLASEQGTHSYWNLTYLFINLYLLSKVIKVGF